MKMPCYSSQEKLDETRRTRSTKRRHLNGKKGGGKKGTNGDDSCIETNFYDGKEEPMICGFPVMVQDLSCAIVENEGRVYAADNSSAVYWQYLATEGSMAVNLDTHKTYYTPPGSFSSRLAGVRGQFADSFTYIGSVILNAFKASNDTASTMIPDGPYIIHFDGYWEGTWDRSTGVTVQTSTAFDGTVVDICAMLA
mmetsp:Transcript_30868/g.64427  ORF Transcript_30868/g.64427 Transcript_30868/m.64427 type:complete len:196 (-) Transcript_30868:72-659(-)